MTDLFYMPMLIHILGRDYVVSHRAGAIEYLIPAKGKVHARFTLDDASIADIMRVLLANARNTCRKCLWK
jgi:hypothetical protein